MEANIPTPNPAITAALISNDMRSVVARRGAVALAAYQAIVARRTGQLAASAHVDTFIGGSRGDRWCARLTVSALYAASHEFGTDRQSAAHDLNRVLNLLAAL